MTPLNILPASTALVLIDLQHGVVTLPLAPRSGAEVVANAAILARHFRALGAPVVLVRAAFSPDGADALAPLTDAPAAAAHARPANWATLVPEIGSADTDIMITKRQWGAFHGTELDLQLRRRRITTLVLGGIATNMGVESTARAAFEHGYQQIFVEDAMSNLIDEGHRFAVQHIFTRMGRVRSSAQVIEALAGH